LWFGYLCYVLLAICYCPSIGAGDYGKFYAYFNQRRAGLNEEKMYSKYQQEQQADRDKQSRYDRSYQSSGKVKNDDLYEILGVKSNASLTEIIQLLEDCL